MGRICSTTGYRRVRALTKGLFIKLAAKFMTALWVMQTVYKAETDFSLKLKKQNLLLSLLQFKITINIDMFPKNLSISLGVKRYKQDMGRILHSRELQKTLELWVCLSILKFKSHKKKNPTTFYIHTTRHLVYAFSIECFISDGGVTNIYMCMS